MVSLQTLWPGHLVTEEFQKGSGTDNVDAFVFLKAEQIRISRNNECRLGFNGSRDVLVVVRIIAGTGQLILARNELSEHDDILEPQLGIDAST